MFGLLSERVLVPPRSSMAAASNVRLRWVVRLAHHLRDDVMRNAKNLKGLVDPVGQYKYYIFPHLPEAFRAARAKYKEKMDTVDSTQQELTRHSPDLGTSIRNQTVSGWGCAH